MLPEIFSKNQEEGGGRGGGGEVGNISRWVIENIGRFDKWQFLLI